jgi:hypothetical protein
MSNPKTAHLNNLVGQEDGEGQNGPIRTYKGTKANLKRTEAQSSALKAVFEAPRCSGTETRTVLVESGEFDYWGNPVRPISRTRRVETGCGALLETQSGFCWDCLGRKAADPGLVRLREFKALNRLLRGVEPAEAVDYTEQRNESIRYPEQNSGPELLKGLALDSFTFVEKERRLDLEWGGAGENWEGKALSVFFALGLPYGPDLPGYKDLAGLVAKASWRVAQADPNRLNLVGDLESYLWWSLLNRADTGLNWEVVKLEIAGAYRKWYKRLNELKVLSSDAQGNAISLERRAYAEREAEGWDGEWLANESDYRTYHWESYVEAQANVDQLLEVLPEDIREIVVKKASGVPIVKGERDKLSRWLRGGPTKRRTTPDGRNTETPENSFQVQMILEGGLPAGRNGIVSWHKAHNGHSNKQR